MLIYKGEKIYVITRRLFEKDVPRHFVGEVFDVAENVVKVRGYAFVYDAATGAFVKREDARTRFFSIDDSGFVINVLPREAVIDEVQYLLNDKNERVISDGKTFKMNASEFGLTR